MSMHELFSAHNVTTRQSILGLLDIVRSKAMEFALELQTDYPDAGSPGGPTVVCGSWRVENSRPTRSAWSRTAAGRFLLKQSTTGTDVGASPLPRTRRVHPPATRGATASAHAIDLGTRVALLDHRAFLITSRTCDSTPPGVIGRPAPPPLFGPHSIFRGTRPHSPDLPLRRSP